MTPQALGLDPNLTGRAVLGSDRVRALRARRTGCDCGSGCDGQRRRWDCDRPGLSPAACRRVGRETARRIREHVRARGTVPQGWERWADEILEPTVDWRRELAAHIRRGAADVAGRVDFTYRRPSRRQAAVPEIVLPSLRQPLPRVARRRRHLREHERRDARAGARRDRRRAPRASASRGATCASSAATPRPTRPRRCATSARSTLAGGGGTDMGRGVEAAAALRPQPDLIVVLTDGFTPVAAGAAAADGGRGRPDGRAGADALVGENGAGGG